MSAVILGREHWYAAVARRWNRAWGDPSDTPPVIYLRQANGAATWVVVEPTCGIDSVYFPSHSAAADHAHHLQKLHGWIVINEKAGGAL
ncbi:MULTISPECIES: hypothetical protein [unclassified Sphingomonas]|uniref:hypothetical protein n=1 Tax=unclassified Sphingomonas TaxID=196159 RepID=UPI00226A49FE|nr:MULTISPECIES: hypothetical protein [unclassified Sphingomonas]